MNIPTTTIISIRARQVLRFAETGYIYADKLKPDDIKFVRTIYNDTTLLTYHEPVYLLN
jgi:hypothetical protein